MDGLHNLIRDMGDLKSMCMVEMKEKNFEKIRDNRYKYCVSKLYTHSFDALISFRIYLCINESLSNVSSHTMKFLTESSFTF